MVKCLMPCNKGHENFLVYILYLMLTLTFYLTTAGYHSIFKGEEINVHLLIIKVLFF